MKLFLTLRIEVAGWTVENTHTGLNYMLDPDPTFLVNNSGSATKDIYNSLNRKKHINMNEDK